MHLAVTADKILVWRELSIDRAAHSAACTTRIITIACCRRIFPVHAASFPALTIQPINLLIKEVFQVLLPLLRLLVLRLVDCNVPLAVVVERNEQLEVLVDLQILE